MVGGSDSLLAEIKSNEYDIICITNIVKYFFLCVCGRKSIFSFENDIIFITITITYDTSKISASFTEIILKCLNFIEFLLWLLFENQSFSEMFYYMYTKDF